MSKLDINFSLVLPEVERQLKRIADVIANPDFNFAGGSLSLANLSQTHITHSIGGLVMFRVPAAQANIPYAIELPRVVNAEGGVVPGWTVTSLITSDNDTAIRVTGDPALLTGEIEVVGAGPLGEPNQATVTVTFTATHPTDADSPRTALIAEVFIVEAGDEVGFAGGTLSFTGITPEPIPA